MKIFFLLGEKDKTETTILKSHFPLQILAIMCSNSIVEKPGF